MPAAKQVEETKAAPIDLGGEAKLRDAIADAIENPEVKNSAADVANHVFAHHRDLVDAWVLPRLNVWTIEKLRALVLRLIPAKPSPLAALQQQLPGMMKLAMRLPVKSGDEVRLADMTTSQLREAIKALRHRELKRLDPKLEELQDLLNRMSPFAQTHHAAGKPLTVRQYCELAAAGAPTTGAFNADERRAIAKKKWEAMPAKQRSAIAKKRERKKRLTGAGARG